MSDGIRRLKKEATKQKAKGTVDPARVVETARAAWVAAEAHPATSELHDAFDFIREAEAFERAAAEYLAGKGGEEVRG